MKHQVVRISRHIRLLSFYLESMWQLVICKLLILYCPFRYYAKQYGYPQSETLYEPLSHALDDIKAIATVLRVLPRYLPWESKCLDQAMAASRMLKRRKLQHTLYFGLMHTPSHSKMAHAWLRAGEHWVIGYQPQVHYAIVGVYAWVV